MPDNSETLAEMWGDFIGWEQRLEGPDADFLIDQVRINIKDNVLDAALGDGINTVQLQKQGFRVTGNEIDPAFIRKALQNAAKYGQTLTITRYNWLDLDKHFLSDTFGSIVCIGNSLTYLPTNEGQQQALRNFKHILKPDGRLIIDERNYQYILDNREEILAGNFRYSGLYVYHGQKVHAHPVSIANDEVIMEYAHQETGTKGYLKLYPFKKDELLTLLRQSGFSDVQQFSDYTPGYNDEADFHQYVCIK